MAHAAGGFRAFDSDLPPPLDPHRAPPANRFCDLVLRGGVVDGVIYPWAILELARHYRFQSLAGTSVGAMAAALTAAAEYGRRLGSPVGFDEVLRRLPAELAKTQPDGRTKLFSLFRPIASGQRLFHLFVEVAGAWPDGWIRAGVMALLSAYVWTLSWMYAALSALHLSLHGRAMHDALSLGLGADASLPREIGVWTLVAMAAPLTAPGCLLLVLVVVLLWALYRDLQHGLVAQGYGLCPGSYPEAQVAGPVPLMNWLHEGIQAASGRPLHQPLTFGDLWTAPGGPDLGPDSADTRKRKPRSIDLRVMSTNLNHGRPYQFPLQPDGERLFFNLEVWRSHFPAEVLAHLEQVTVPYRPLHSDDPGLPEGISELRELPHGRLPVLVAARLSLSFPVLFSTVPLWAMDERSGLPRRRFKKCLFTDGGVCSNFPIHVFDSAVPEWPTFGITLEDAAVRGRGEEVWVTESVTEGGEDVWSPLDTQGSDAGLGQFGGRLISTMMNWSDDTTLRLPGVRDRVVHVSQTKNQSLNLKLTGDEIMHMARVFGQPAGLALVKKFAQTESGPPAPAWSEHRWLRFQSFLLAIRQRVQGLGRATQGVAGNLPLRTQLSEAIRQSPIRAPNPDGLPLTEPQAESLSAVLQALQALEQGLSQHPVEQPLRLHPTPELHPRPPI